MSYSSLLYPLSLPLALVVASMCTLSARSEVKGLKNLLVQISLYQMGMGRAYRRQQRLLGPVPSLHPSAGEEEARLRAQLNTKQLAYQASFAWYAQCSFLVNALVVSLFQLNSYLN